MQAKTMRAEERRAFWQTQLANWSQSGLSQAAYCRAQGLNGNRFRWWKRQLTRASGASQQAAAGSFLAVKVHPQALIERSGNASGVTLRLASGVRVEVACGFDAPTLQAVVETLRR